MAKEKFVFVSPHFDDAVGSCGGVIKRLVDKDHDVIVLTVTGGKAPKNLSAFAQTFHDRMGLTVEDDPVQNRADENQVSVKMLGAQTVDLDFHDAIYRSDQTGTYVYSAESQLFGGKPLDPEDVYADLETKLLAAIPDDAIVVFPSGIGGHVDHALTRDVGLRLAEKRPNVMFYRDFWYKELEYGKPVLDTYTAHPIFLTPEEVEAKTKAMLAYVSQYPFLFGGEQETIDYFQTELVKDGKPVEMFYSDLGLPEPFSG